MEIITKYDGVYICADTSGVYLVHDGVDVIEKGSCDGTHESATETLCFADDAERAARITELGLNE